MKSLFVLSVAVVVSGAVWAADLELTKTVKDFDPFASDQHATWRYLGTSDVLDRDIVSDDVCYIYGYNFSTAKVTNQYPCGTIHVGKADGTKAGTVQLGNTVKFPQIYWHCGGFVNNIGGSEKSVSVTTGCTVEMDCANASHTISFSTATPSSEKPWSNGIAAPIVCTDTGAVLECLLNASAADDCKNSKSGAYLDAQISLTGDNADFAGQVYVHTFGHLALGHVNAAGAPETLVPNKIRLGANGRLAVKKGVVINANCGITVEGEGARLVARTYARAGVDDCSEYELPMPIAGDYGLEKVGSGSVKLSGAYSAGNLVVSEGTLQLATGFSCDPSLVITVRSGATLKLAPYLANALTIDREEGAEVVWAMDDLVYDDETATVAAPYQLPSTFTVTEGEPLQIKLDTPIAPFVAEGPKSSELALKVAEIAPGAAPVTSNDFVDATEKDHCLPHTWFEISTSASGAQEVYLHVKPYAKSTKIFNKNNGYLCVTPSWTDEQIEHEGWDYLLVHSAQTVNSTPEGALFRGDSLTIALGVSTFTLGRAVTINSCRVYPGVTLRSNGGTANFAGDDWEIVAVEGQEDNPVVFVPYTASKPYPVSLDMVLHGSGPIKISSNAATNDTYATISMDNSAYKGRWTFSCNPESKYPGAPTDDGIHRGTQVRISSAANLGGALDEPDAAALTIEKYSYLRPKNTLTLATANRGITIGASCGGFYVPEDVTFTLGEPLTVNGTMLKDGPGRFVLSNSTAAASTQTFKVRGGTLKPLTEDCCANLDLVFTNRSATATGLVLDCANAATRACGLVANSIAVEAAETIPVTVENPEKGDFTMALCTLSHGDEDLSGLFAVSPIRGHKVTVSKQAGDATDVYLLTAEKLGMALLIK